MAADHAGIDKSTMTEWAAAGERGDPKYAAFSAALKEADAVAGLRCLGALDIDPAWQAKAWILERRWPEEYGRRDAVKVETTTKSDVNLDAFSHEELLSYFRLRLKGATTDQERAELEQHIKNLESA